MCKEGDIVRLDVNIYHDLYHKEKTAEKRREAKGKGEKKRYTHLNAEFQK